MDPNNDGDPSDGIDGWRLDVAREVPIGFWKQWSKLVKSINPNSVIVGELWEASPDFISASGPFDALMNYNFSYAINDFFIADKNKIDTEEFAKRLEEIDINYPEENLYVLQNLLDSHDTDRLSSMIKNLDRNYDRDGGEGNENYNAGKPSKQDYEKQKLIAAFQMCYRGAPMIYYGDEVGMWGADDPHCRKPMIWSDLKYDDEVVDETSGFKTGFGKYYVEQNKDLLSFYKKIIEIRNNSAALQKGDVNFKYLNDEQKTFTFQRKYKDDLIICAFNIGTEASEVSFATDFPKASYLNIITNEVGMLTSTEANAILVLSLPPNSFKIIRLYEGLTYDK
jgi:glycosidase